MKPETERDIGNVEAWAEIIGDLLFHVPADNRAEVLALAMANEEHERKEREAHGGWKFHTLSDDFMKEPAQRHWNAITRLKSLVIQVFVRDVANNHSPKDAASILFTEHPYGTGSRLLKDYLPRDRSGS